MCDWYIERYIHKQCLVKVAFAKYYAMEIIISHTKFKIFYQMGNFDNNLWNIYLIIELWVKTEQVYL